jgi:hypothetical protein
MQLLRRCTVLGLALLLSQVLYPCSIVMIGGYTPTRVRQVSGTVFGSDRIDLMGNSHNDERHSTLVPGALISVKARTDTAFFKEKEIQYPPGMKHSAGTLKEWKCGSAMAEVRTDQAGNFDVPALKPGKYCLDITSPPATDTEECGRHAVESGKSVCAPMHASFLIDVARSAAKATLLADISPRWPDCSGGEYLQLRPLK